MKHLAATLSAMLIPILGLGACSGQKAAIKAQQQKEKEKQELIEQQKKLDEEKKKEEEAKQKEAERQKRLREEEMRHPKVVYGPPPASYERIGNIDPEDGAKK